MDRAKRVGPKLEVVASCSGCAFAITAKSALESVVQVWCEHPEISPKEDLGYIGVDTWRTPAWCPLLGAALRSLGPDPALGRRIWCRIIERSPRELVIDDDLGGHIGGT